MFKSRLSDEASSSSNEFAYCWSFSNIFQPYDKARNAVALALSPVVRALVDPNGALQDIRNLDDVS